MLASDSQRAAASALANTLRSNGREFKQESESPPSRNGVLNLGAQYCPWRPIHNVLPHSSSCSAQTTLNPRRAGWRGPRQGVAPRRAEAQRPRSRPGACAWNPVAGHADAPPGHSTPTVFLESSRQPLRTFPVAGNAVRYNRILQRERCVGRYRFSGCRHRSHLPPDEGSHLRPGDPVHPDRVDALGNR